MAKSKTINLDTFSPQLDTIRAAKSFDDLPPEYQAHFLKLRNFRTKETIAKNYKGLNPLEIVSSVAPLVSDPFQTRDQTREDFFKLLEDMSLKIARAGYSPDSPIMVYHLTDKDRTKKTPKNAKYGTIKGNTRLLSIIGWQSPDAKGELQTFVGLPVWLWEYVLPHGIVAEINTDSRDIQHRLSKDHGKQNKLTSLERMREAYRIYQTYPSVADFLAMGATNDFTINDRQTANYLAYRVPTLVRDAALAGEIGVVTVRDIAKAMKDNNVPDFKFSPETQALFDTAKKGELVVGTTFAQREQVIQNVKAIEPDIFGDIFNCLAKGSNADTFPLALAAIEKLKTHFKPIAPIAQPEHMERQKEKREELEAKVK